MIRKLIIIAVLALFCPLAIAQTTQVSGTVKDANLSPYANGTYNIFLTDNNGNALSSGVIWIGNSNPVAPLQFAGALDANGFFSVPLPQNALIQVPSGGATGTLWQFNICSAKPPSPGTSTYSTLLVGPQKCLKYSTTVSGTTLDLSTPLSALAQPIYYFNAATGACATVNGPCGGGSGGGGVNPSSVAFPVSYYKTPGSLVSPAVNAQYNTTFAEQVLKIPTVNILHTDFGALSGCPNTADPTGTNDSSCPIQSAINYAQALTAFGGGIAVVYVPVGVYRVAAGLTMPSSVYLIGDSQTSSTLNFTNVSIAITFNASSFAGVQNLGFTCPQSTSTGCTQGISIVNGANNIRILDSTFNSIGWNTNFSSGHAVISVESANNVTIQRNVITQTGGSAYVILTDGLNGSNPFVQSYNIFIKDNQIFANNSIITIAGFELESSEVTGNYIDQNNYFSSPSCANACGYAVMAYERGLTAMNTTGATLSGTNTITVTFASPQLPTVPPTSAYDLIISGVTSCSGTQPNGTFLATPISQTQATFTSTGTTCSSVPFNVGAVITPKVLPGRDVIANNNIFNTAGSAIYLQTSHNTSVTGNVVQNCAQQQTVVSLSVGCIAIGGGNNLTLAGNSVICTKIRGEDLQTATNVSVQGDNIDMSCAAGANGTALHANNLQNSDVNVTTEGAKQGMLIQGSVSGNKFRGVLNDSILDGIAVADATAINNEFTVTVNSTVSGNVCSSNIGKSNTFIVQCNGAGIFENGTNSTYKNSSIMGVGSGTAFTIATSTASVVDNLTVVTAGIGVLYTGAVTDSTVRNSKFISMSSAALDDIAAVQESGTFNGTTSVTVASCGPFLNGALLGDYTGLGNNWIPIGTTVSSCTGTTLVMSNAATGSGTENFKTNGNISKGINWINNQATGNFPTQQPCLLSHAIQDLVIKGGWCKGYYGFGTNGAIVDIREMTNVQGGLQTISDMLVVGGALGTDTGIQTRDNATNFRIQNNTVNATSQFSVGDISSQSVNSFFNNISAVATNLTTNPNTVLVHTYVTGTGTFTTATSDAFTIQGVRSTSQCTFTPTNATAAASTVAGYVSAASTNSVTITHVATTASGGTVNISCTNN